jgi:hypothetical protein
VTNKNTLVCLNNGERFEAGRSTDAGVEFDGGTIEWDQISHFLVWSESRLAWFSVPVN